MPRQVHSSRLVSANVASSSSSSSDRANTLGHLEWTSEARRHFGPMRPRATRQVETLRTVGWWRDTYVSGRMAVHLGERNARALVEWYSGGNYWEVTTRYRKGPRWLARLDRRARRLARTLYYPDTTAQNVTI